MQTPHIPVAIRAKLSELWKAHEAAQAGYVAARAYADLVKIHGAIEHYYPTPVSLQLEPASNQRTAIREELRKLYFEYFNQRGVDCVEAYFAAVDNKYGRSHRYKFVSKTGDAGRAAAAEAELARDKVNKLTRRPHVL